MIYFIHEKRFNLIKIGFTTNLFGRFPNESLLHTSRQDLLGVMPGDKRDERAIHRTLHRFWARREYFHPTSEVLALVDQCAAPWDGVSADLPQIGTPFHERYEQALSGLYRPELGTERRFALLAAEW